MAPSPLRHSSSAGDDDDAIVALEQVAAPSTSGLPDSAVLPSDLEARFRKLKSFAATFAKSPSVSPPQKHSTPRRLDPPESPPISPVGVQKDRKAPVRSIVEGDRQDQNFPAPGASEKTESKSKSDLGSSSSSSLSLASSKEQSASPPSAQCCCFVFTPKKAEAPPGSSVHALEKEQRKQRKALREQEKLTREAAKMVRWARQASKRMNAGSMDEFLSHGEEEFK